MNDAVNRLLDLGLGLAVVTKETARALVGELVQKGQVSDADGKELVETLGRKGEQARADLQSLVADLVQRQMDRIPVVSRKDHDALEARVEALEHRLAALEKEPKAES